MQDQRRHRAAGNPSDPFAGLKAFVVEDEGGVALLLEDMLIDLGFDIARSVARLGEALDVARAEAFDVAILDVNLAGEASFPIASILSERGTPFIFSTGYGATILPPEFVGCPVLGKPYALEQLTTALRSVLNKAAGGLQR